MNPGETRRVVLSHAPEDKEDVQKLRVALADRGVSAWEDVLELRLGQRRDAVKAAISMMRFSVFSGSM